ncbi:MAG: dTDP-4-dehydrorhamnose reductase [Candidatus Glassbacteria bacterium RIFCSPLOWO2_12_FULL_58_11]|uniref:dTDP-4-dehydrorhamnose reductase n=1 Tax=Candidatus Glassbacteria bacterium RIFCSPLOWO2_12_FULL_58_11 TaxID=1817867 RepID=A0A1F5YKR6_9BACT|nr:MAG: dTDP-4-dehydrorhamnose reductase [Candidatus Glassbacteria bacterium RIFCSPLOWO2_12_FULL_58_11]
MRILVTGAAGMLGKDLVPVLARKHRVRGADLADFDVTDREAAERFIGAERPEMVIHAAAFTDVEGAEHDPARVMRVNADGARNVAAACGFHGARLILISTDYVFDGTKGAPYVESDRPAPLNVYGRSKLEGERLARQELPGVTVIRTAWLYSAGGRNNFPAKILKAARKGKSLKVVADEVGSPTWAADLAKAIGQIVDLGAAGPLYHLAGGGFCSRFEMAMELFSCLGIRDCELVKVSRENYPANVLRPQNSSLDSERIGREGIKPLRNWKESLREFAGMLGSHQVG